ncbi:putative protein N(5)-glutamine methyltransferase [Nonomuraea sp. NBC_01738]|uniref:putative protein N(5)-glutamine methyltransferase n=1 Tax=Nonomuraea sp. NBC_01738 TaxID=2976003 RepID=UPI002E12B813|nr:putative protein N(5)-glutamine methyltransferase [Nonomuraea sp. NBC_01738]
MSTTLDDITTRLRAAGCVFAEDEAALITANATNPRHLAAMVDQRVHGHPLEHVLGWAEFCGLRLTVEPGVFVPRQRTQFLARHATHLAQRHPHPTAVDLCCGAGAVAAVLATHHPGAHLHAADIDPRAVHCARTNLDPYDIPVHQGDLYDPLPPTLRGHIDILVANVPYVPTADLAYLPAEARLHEPRIALDGGPDGLDILRRVTAQATHWLAPGGHLLFETSSRQAPHARQAVTDHGLTPHLAHDDDLHATILIATKPAH